MPQPRRLPIALESPLLRGAGFRHGFSTRPLDFRPGASDLAAHEESLALVLRMPAARLYRVSQVHGARAIVVGGAAAGDPSTVAAEQADALLTRQADTAVMVRVADCVPILLADSKTGAVAAVHAGWRGLVAGVVANAIAEGVRAGARFDLAAIGPCIGACCFEVSDDVADQIAAASTAEAKVAQAAGHKPHADLRAAARAQLVAQGLHNTHIDDVAGCTRCDAELFFSHRRDAAESGRQVGVIATRAMSGAME
jgi:YfiH family protein